MVSNISLKNLQTSVEHMQNIFNTISVMFKMMKDMHKSISYEIFENKILGRYRECFHVMIIYTTVADPGGATGTPPMGPNSFIFAYVSAKKCPCWRSVPPHGKSWICSCMICTFLT